MSWTDNELANRNNHDEWRLRGPDDVVHYVDYPSTTTGTHTQCGRTLANLYEVDSKVAWEQQFTIAPTAAVTCVGCIAAGPLPPYKDDIDWPYPEDD